MSGDLVSLRLLVISAFRPTRELWRQGAALASVPIEFLEADVSEAHQSLAKGGIDIVIIDAALGDGDRTALIGAARNGKAAPLIALVGADGTVPAGADRAFPKPANADETVALVERCVRAKLPTRVLIVDDSGTMRSIVRKILSATRYAVEIVEADQGVAALKHLTGANVDVVLLDYNMPGFDGFETLSEIRRVAPRVAVVMMTSTLDEAVAQRAKTAGAAGFLKKPFYPADVDALLDRIYAAPTR